jgi:hypothetical protein
LAGKNVPMINIDSLEADINGNPVALIETKHFKESASLFQRKCLKNLANAAGLPAFLVYHDAECTVFRITAINAKAATWLARNAYTNETISRLDYLAFLHLLHDSKPTETDKVHFSSYAKPKPQPVENIRIFAE